MSSLTPVTARREMAAFLGHKERVEHFTNLLVGKGIDPRVFLAAVQTDAIRQPKLAESIAQSPDTLMDCLSVCAATGLIPGSAHGQFYLIPRYSSKRQRTECTFITGYKGLCDVAYRNPRVFSIAASIAFIGEEFDYDPGSQTLRHKWNPEVKRDALEDIHAVYAQVELATPAGHHAGGKPLLWVMTQKEILAAKARSETGRKGYGPWIDDPLPMARKTALRRLLSSGSVPRQNELTHLMGQESQQEEIDDPAPTSAATGMAGLRSQLSEAAPPQVAEAKWTIPDSIDEQREMLARMRPDEDVGMLPDAEVTETLRRLLGT